MSSVQKGIALAQASRLFVCSPLAPKMSAVKRRAKISVLQADGYNRTVLGLEYTAKIIVYLQDG